MKRVICIIIITLVSFTTTSFVQDKKDDAAKKYAGIIGEYNFKVEGEIHTVKFYLEKGKLTGMGEYSLGFLKPVKDKDLKFMVETEYGEKWSFEFIKDEKGKITKCKWRDEDFGMGVTGDKVIKEDKKK